MTREEAKKFLPLIEAYAEGKEIEYRYRPDLAKSWEPIDNPAFTKPPDQYRIVPDCPFEVGQWVVCANDRHCYTHGKVTEVTGDFCRLAEGQPIHRTFWPKCHRIMSPPTEVHEGKRLLPTPIKVTDGCNVVHGQFGDVWAAGIYWGIVDHKCTHLWDQSGGWAWSWEEAPLPAPKYRPFTSAEAKAFINSTVVEASTREGFTITDVDERGIACGFYITFEEAAKQLTFLCPTIPFAAPIQ